LVGNTETNKRNCMKVARGGKGSRPERGENNREDYID